MSILFVLQIVQCTLSIVHSAKNTIVSIEECQANTLKVIWKYFGSLSQQGGAHLKEHKCCKSLVQVNEWLIAPIYSFSGIFSFLSVNPLIKKIHFFCKFDTLNVYPSRSGSGYLTYFLFFSRLELQTKGRSGQNVHRPRKCSLLKSVQTIVRYFHFWQK